MLNRGVTFYIYFCAYFFFVFCGKSIEWDSNFFLVHHNIIAYYRFLVILPILIFAGFLFDKFLNASFINTFIKTILLVSVSVYSLYYGFNILLNRPVVSLNDRRNETVNFRTSTYILEKYSRLVQLKKLEDIYIPYSITWFLRDELKKEFEYNNGRFFWVYLARLYYDEKFLNVNVHIVDDDIAEKIFNENGGVLTEDELKNYKFQNLMNDDFILGKIK